MAQFTLLHKDEWWRHLKSNGARCIEAWVSEPMSMLYGLTGDSAYIGFTAMIEECLESPEKGAHSHGFLSTLRGLQVAALITGDNTWNTKVEKYRQTIIERHYEMPDGGTSIDYDRAWLGIQHRTSPKLSLDAQIGGGNADDDSRFIYEVGADIQPADELAMRLSYRQDLFAVSPLATKLGIERRANALYATWTPDLRYTVASYLGYDTFSDGNDRWEAELAPRRAFLRTQRLNLDLGVSGRWFSYDEDPGNGYYAPSLYQRYALTAFTYWKISDDDGVSVAFSYGPYKDNTMSGFRAGGDIVAEGFFGIYRDWYLNVKAGVSHYGGGATAAYDSRMFEINLTRRF